LTLLIVFCMFKISQDNFMLLILKVSSFDFFFNNRRIAIMATTAIAAIHAPKASNRVIVTDYYKFGRPRS
ncbi:hypothetical protein, partial [Muribaculum intestinale]